jgi:PBSX family phage terminase large subunit
MTTLEAPAPTGELLHTYAPRGAARKLLGCRDNEVLLAGPAGTGKSRACLEKVNLAALKYPGMRGLLVRQVRDTLASTALKTLDEFVIKEQLAAGAVRYHGATGREPARYRYHNGSELWIAGMDKPSKIMSTEFDMIYVQEATELAPQSWDSLTTRLRRFTMPYRQIIADCNPDAPTHWLKLRVDGGTTTMFESRHEDNPILFSTNGSVTIEGAEYIARLDKLTGVRKDRLRYGRWASAEGVIFDEFDPIRHLVEFRDWRRKNTKDWQRFWTVDFGYVHPFVLQCWARDPDGALWRYREIYMTETMVEDHARHIMKITRPGVKWVTTNDDGSGRWEGGQLAEPAPLKVICDHDAEDRATLERYLGMSTTKADKRVKRGLEAVNKRFKEDRLFLVKGALLQLDEKRKSALKPTCTEQEIPGYVWAKPKDGSPKEEPVKEDDDGCDGMRYAVAHFDLRPRLISKDRSVWL